MRRALMPVILAGLWVSMNTGAQTQTNSLPSSTEIVARLRAGHPRLIATADDFARLKERVATDPVLREWHRKLRARAEKMLHAPVSRYEIPDGLRLLATSRRVLERTQTLALLYRLDGDVAFRDRCWRELEAAADYPDWNPKHFLDTAEMTHAFAIGYDWLYHTWTPAQRATLRRAMITKGLKPALAVYHSGGWWTKAAMNWNQVCNGGIGMGALAIGDEAPDLAGGFLHDAIQSLPLAMTQYAPDGAWAEGPGYWQYATEYTVMFLAALNSALGTDFGLSQIDGFSKAGLFPIYMTGPLQRTFNFADAEDGPIRAPELFWLADRFHRPEYARYEERFAVPRPLDLVWRPATALQENPSDMPLDKYFRGAEVVTFRSAWNDPRAVFVGFKAGDNDKVSHGHLDLGTFVLDALGQRWALDLGRDNYNLPGYFSKQRWTYYRLRAEGHNTLVLNPGADVDQDRHAAAKITRFESKPARAFAIANLTPAYAAHARHVERGIALFDRRQVLVQDEVRADKPAEVWWFLHTTATITISENGRAATLAQAGERLVAKLLSPANARFTEMPAAPLPSSPNPSGQNPNAGIRKLAIHLTGVTETRVAVSLAAEPASPKVVPLAEW